MDYTDFVSKKLRANILSGFEPSEYAFHPDLLPHQFDLVRVALKTGRYCIWADTGLGKAFMGLEWASHVCDHTNKPVLIVAPLGVAHQIAEVEAPKFGYDAVFIESDSDVVQGINVTNYEKLDRFDLSVFSGVVLDESSILKAATGRTRQFIIEAFANTPYKLACSATPAPNDHIELGNQCEFVGALTMNEMLAEYFVHDGGSTQNWRLKGHAESRFWEFVSSWASYISNPSQLGYDGSAYVLPPIEYHEHMIGSWDDLANAEELLRHQATGLSEQRSVRSSSLDERCQIVLDVINKDPDKTWLVWCETNAESALISKLIDGIVEVKGADSDSHKKDAMIRFGKGEIKRLVSKPSICGFGMNFQVCHNVIYLGITHCYSEDTEILTTRGWLNFSEVTLDDRVATVNQKSLEWEWQQPTEVIWQDYSGEMINFKNKGFDLLVTPNHNMFVSKNTARFNCEESYELKQADELMHEFKRQKFMMLNTAKTYIGKSIESIEIPMIKMRMTPRRKIVEQIASEDFMKLAGWYLSEGCCADLNGDHAGQIVISQTDKNPENREEIIELLTKIGLNVYSETKDIRVCSKQLATFLCETFGRGSKNMKIPFWVKELDKHLLSILRDTMLKGDGCFQCSETKIDDKARSLRTVSPQLADDFQEICLKTGVRASVIKMTGVNKLYPFNDVYTVNLAWQYLSPAINIQPMIETYRGKIGCVSVPNRTVIVRRNGIPVVSGNSFEQWYQSVRRVYRFGQKNTVHVHIIQHVLEGAIVANLKRKENAAAEMALSLSQRLKMGTTRIEKEYSPNVAMEVPKWLVSA